MSETEYRVREQELSWREVDGEIVLLDERDWTYLHLNGTGATLWKALADGNTVDGLVGVLLGEYEVERDTARADTVGLLDQLVERELVTAVPVDAA